jgi:uncharacterized protein
MTTSTSQNPAETSSTLDSGADSREARSTFDPVPVLSAELGLPAASVRAVVKLLAENATVPFIARYRKEATGGLDEVQIRAIEERRAYLIELEERRAQVLAEIQKQGKLTPELEGKLRAATTKAEIEDLYLPYKPKRRTRAMIARERGLEPLADLMWAQGADSPEAAAAAFVDAAKEVPDVMTALAGARDICSERIADTAEVRALVRETTAQTGVLRVSKSKDFADKPTKFDTYADYEEPVSKMPSHRVLAIRRGEAENVLSAGISIDVPTLLSQMSVKVGLGKKGPWAGELEKALNDAYKRLLAVSSEIDVRVEMKLRADKEAVSVFAANLRELLLAAPYGTKAVLGVDPGQRTGCKCAVVDATGKMLEHTTFNLVLGDSSVERARGTLLALVKKHGVAAVAVGNGTHGRDPGQRIGRQRLLGERRRARGVPRPRPHDPRRDLDRAPAAGSAGRAGEGRSEEHRRRPVPARRPAGRCSRKKLDEVVESCVNSVGVELNTASAPLLGYVAGIGPTLAKRIVAHRDEHGAFASRAQGLLEVAGLGPKTFEQCAGFLRVRRRRAPARRERGAPRALRAGREHREGPRRPVVELVGNASSSRRIDVAEVRRRRRRRATLRDILRRAEEARPRSARDCSSRRSSATT